MASEKKEKKGGSIARYCGFGLGAIGLDLSYGMFNQFLNKYLTDVLKLHSSFLLFLSSFARIWDGINDPMMGSIVDRSNLKMGKYRPWILFGTCANAVVLIFLFNNIFSLNSAALYVYMAFMYIFWGMSNTVADIPYWSMVPSFTNNPKERNLVATIARAFSGLGQGIVQIMFPLLMTAVSVTYDPGSNKKVYDALSFKYASIACAVFLIVFAVLCVSVTKETRRTPPSGEKFSFKNSLKIIKNNDQLLVFMLFAMLSNAGWYLTSATSAYYFDVVIGDTTKQSTFGTFGAVGSIAGLLVIPILTKYTSKKRTYQISLLMGIIGYVFMCIFGEMKLIIPMDIAYIVASVGIASMFVAQTVFLSDIVDYGEVKMGFRAQSVTFSMKGFLQKMAYTLQTVMLYSFLWGTKYNGDLHSQNSKAVHGSISFMMYIAPIILLIASLIIFSTKYKLHGEYMDKITQQISENIKKEQDSQQ